MNTRPGMIAGGLVMIAVALGATASEKPQEGDLKAQLAVIQKEAKASAALIQVQEKTTKDLEHRLKAVETWMRSLPAAMNTLESAITEVESSGFTNAGANPRARELLLTALRGLATNLKSSIPSLPSAK